MQIEASIGATAGGTPEGLHLLRIAFRGERAVLQLFSPTMLVAEMTPCMPSSKDRVMTTARQLIIGSEQLAPRDIRLTVPAAAHDSITISVYLRPEAEMPSQPNGAFPTRATLRQMRDEVQASNLAAVRQFAGEAGLEVVEADAAKRLVKLRGTASALEAAFGTTLHLYEHEGVTYRGREGGLSAPVYVAARILAVLGLDTTPVATPKFVLHRA